MTPDERLERRLYQIYAKASKELTQKANSYFERFKRLDAQKREQVKAGTLSEQEYQKWRQNRIMEGKRWTDFQKSVSETMTHANEVAAAYMNHELPPMYAKNFNEVCKDAERHIKGIFFDLTDANTVRNLSTNNKTLLPYKFVDFKRDVRWNTRKVNASILQSILQGEDLKQMTKRLALEIPEMNMASARRNAQTAFTGAQNKGRLDGMKELQDKGVIIEKEWLATTGDGRTRDAHLELHHVTAPIDKPFENSIGQIMYPGDPQADPSNVYNCRCTIATVYRGVKRD